MSDTGVFGGGAEAGQQVSGAGINAQAGQVSCKHQQAFCYRATNNAPINTEITTAHTKCHLIQGKSLL